ncbi:hypothetical protein GCM10023205_02600 [Yinghuangia aomiensis]|uniref:Phosphotransferase enzyme family protein n=1 Tax=Yinghuangia aomiensis TaxID=676205 RepID=A0ABP9GKA5_9ACTN
MPEKRPEHLVEIVLPRTVGQGGANEVVRNGQDGAVVRAATTAPAGDAFDLRVLDENLTRSALATTRPGVFPPAPLTSVLPTNSFLHDELTPLPEATSPAEYDGQLEALIESHAQLARESIDAARELRPHQQKSLEYLADLTYTVYDRLPLANAAEADHFEVARADVVRVASVVRTLIGGATMRRLGLARAQQLSRDLSTMTPEAVRATSKGPWVVAHGDPTLGNLMTDKHGRLVLNDYDLAFVAPAPHAAAHTWATLRLRAPHEPSPARRRQFFSQVPGAKTAERWGLPSLYEEVEIQRSAESDVARAALGQLPLETAWLSLRSANGGTLGFDEFRAVMESTAGRMPQSAPYFPFLGLTTQPKTLDGRRATAAGADPTTPLEARLSLLQAVDEAASDESRVPAEVREQNDLFLAMARERLAAAAPGTVLLPELVARVRDARQVTIVEVGGRTLYRGAPPRYDRQADQRKER